MNQLKFNIGQSVAIVVSCEVGSIIGRAEYANSEPAYLLRYANKQGDAVESWWSESALTSR